MLLVIFGAGASYDSAPSYPSGDGKPHRPPLANELFADRPEFGDVIDRFRECQPIIPRLRHRKGDALVERVLEQLQAEAANYPQGHRQLTAVRYYLHVMLWQCENNWYRVHKGITNYKTLLDQINRWQRKTGEEVCLVTFNYDRMLEDALPNVGIVIESLNDYVNSSEYKIIKLHGSVNWGRVVDANPAVKELYELRDDQLPKAVIRLSPELLEMRLITNEYKIVHQAPMGKEEGAVMFPALAIPVESKLDFECPKYHLDVLKRCLPEATKLLIIGWRATDLPFLELLSRNLKRTIGGFVVAGNRNEADDVVKQLHALRIKGTFGRGEGGFTNFMLRDDLGEFLGP